MMIHYSLYGVNLKKAAEVLKKWVAMLNLIQFVDKENMIIYNNEYDFF